MERYSAGIRRLARRIPRVLPLVDSFFEGPECRLAGGGKTGLGLGRRRLTTESGGAVHVAAGMYAESLTVQKSLDIFSKNAADAPVINGAGKYVYAVTVNGTDIDVTMQKQVIKIQASQHWCQQSVEKLSPWIWLMQNVVGLWYITEGHKVPAARTARRRFGKWDTQWSLAHMLHILRTVILEHTIKTRSATRAELCQLLDDLENYLNLAA